MQDFIILGFGMGLHLLFLASPIENVVYTIFVLVLGERKIRTKTLLFGTLFLALMSTTSFFIYMALEYREEPFEFFLKLPFWMLLIWSWYFVLVPQFIVRKVLSRIPPNRRIWMVVFRVLLSIVLPLGLCGAHAYLGSLWGIPNN